MKMQKINIGTKKKNLLVITPFFYPENYKINDLVINLSKKYNKIFVFTQNKNYDLSNSNYLKKNILIHTFPSIKDRSKNYFFIFLNYISMIVSSNTCILKFLFYRVDKILIFQTSPIFIIFPALILKFFKNIKIYTWVLDFWPDTFWAHTKKKNKLLDKCLDSICKFLYSRCDKIFVSSHGFKKLFFKLIKREVCFIPQWAEDDFKYIRRCKKSKKKINIFFAGNLGYAQNIDILKKLFLKFRNNDIANFYIFSSGRKIKDLSFFLKKNQIQNVKLNKFLSIKDYFNASKKCDLFLMTIRNKKVFNHTMPARLSTALAMGLPIISYGSKEVNNVIKKSRSGYGIKANKFEDLVNKIIDFYKLSYIQKKKIKHNSYLYYKKYFNKNRQLQKINKIMEL
jgi:glycosyltransferase involved in cell wall biosynthesis